MLKNWGWAEYQNYILTYEEKILSLIAQNNVLNK